MPNPTKYSTTSTSGSYQKGNVAIGTNPIAYDSTWVNSPIIANGTFVVKEVGAVGVPKFYSPTTTDEWIRLAKQEGATGADTGSVAAIQNWFASQVNYDVSNIDLPYGMPNIVGNGLILNVDADIAESYPGSGTTWTDLSGMGSNGTLINGPTYSNGSIVFDGVDDYSSFGNATGTDFNGNTNEFTIEALFKVPPSPVKTTLGSIFDRYRYSFYYRYNDNKVSMVYVNKAFDDTSVYSTTSITSPTLNTQGRWNYVLVTYTKSGDSGSLSMYINGNAPNTTNGLRMTNNYPLAPAWIGNSQHLGSTYYWYEGNISNLKIYNKALLQSEMLQNYYQAPIVTNGLIFAVDAGNLVSYESGSSTTYSMTGSLSGSLINGVGYSSNNGGYWNFDGIDDSLQFATNAVFERGTSPFTMEAWVRLLDNTGAGAISAIMGGGNPLCDNCDGGYFLFFQGTNAIMLRFDDSGLGNLDSITYTRGTTFEDGIFHHVVGLRDGTNTKIYLDGVLVQTGTDTSPNVNDISTFYISGWSIYRGSMDVAISRIYDRALSASEVSQNFNAQRSRFGI